MKRVLLGGPWSLTVIDAREGSKGIIFPYVPKEPMTFRPTKFTPVIEWPGAPVSYEPVKVYSLEYKATQKDGVEAFVLDGHEPSETEWDIVSRTATLDAEVSRLMAERSIAPRGQDD